MSAKIYYSVKDAAWIVTDRASGKVLTISDLGVITPNKTKGSAYTQTAYSTADKTHDNVTSSAVATTAATTAAYGYTSAQADAIPVAINAVAADLLDLKQLVNSVIDDLQAVGIVG